MESNTRLYLEILKYLDLEGPNVLYSGLLGEFSLAKKKGAEPRFKKMLKDLDDAKLICCEKDKHCFEDAYTILATDT